MALNAAITWLSADDGFHPMGARYKLMNPTIRSIYGDFNLPTFGLRIIPNLKLTCAEFGNSPA
jgi:hypothetical protein